MSTSLSDFKRCQWSLNSPLEKLYHDSEWGVPVHDDATLFEFILLEGAQAGLSWSTILKKREGYRRAFDAFDAVKVADYSAKKIRRILKDPNIIRNPLKIKAAVTNARAFLRVQEEFGSFDAYIWEFVGGRPITNRWTEAAAIPAHTPESRNMSRDLKKRGFTFVGPTICYAFMQAVGMVNDHVMDCFRYAEILKSRA